MLYNSIEESCNLFFLGENLMTIKNKNLTHIFSHFEGREKKKLAKFSTPPQPLKLSSLRPTNKHEKLK
jgi:hypothetical protein